jgi:transposase
VLSLPSALRIFLAVEPADMRKGFDGLAQLVREVIAQDPLSGHLFVFRNRRRDRVKILVCSSPATSPYWWQCREECCQAPEASTS